MIKAISRLVFLGIIFSVLNISVFANPTATPTPLPALNLCDTAHPTTVSSSTLVAGDTIDIKSNANSSSIKKFTYKFFNLDNLNPTTHKPKPIMFKKNTPFVVNVPLTVTSNTHTYKLAFSMINKRDLNWPGHLRPKRILVEAYFTNSANRVSARNESCIVRFTAGTIDPTPMINPLCVCTAAGTCSTQCTFTKYPAQGGISYGAPIKCNLGASVFQSAPNQADKNQWCRSFERTKGDSNRLDGIDLMDYFYYVSAVNNGNIPSSANVDFNGNGVIDPADKAIIIKTLK